MSRLFEDFERSCLYPVPSDLHVVYFISALYITPLRGDFCAPAQPLFCIALGEQQ